MQDLNGWTPLHLAVHLDRHLLVHLLLSNGADIHRRTRG